MISNPAPSAISGGTWNATGGIRSITVNIPTKPADNDLAGIVVLGKSGGSQELTFPDDVFYKGPWAEFIVITTDASNTPLEPNQAYTIGIAAYDEFGTDGIDFGTVTYDVVVLQLETIDIGNDAVDTGNIKDDAVTNAKISSLTADKITAGTITGSTLQTASSGKRFVVSTGDNEAHFYGDQGDGSVIDLCNIGINQVGTDYTIINAGNTTTTHIAAYLQSNSPNCTLFVRNESDTGAIFSTGAANGHSAQFYRGVFLHQYAAPDFWQHTITNYPVAGNFSGMPVCAIWNAKGSTKDGGDIFGTNTSTQPVLAYGDGLNWRRFDGTDAINDDPSVLEGTWTPRLQFSTTDFVGTYTQQSGYYKKIGNFVHLKFKLVLATKTAGTGTLSIVDLPFDVDDTYSGTWENVGSCFVFSGLSTSLSFGDLCLVTSATTSIEMAYYVNGGGGYTFINDTHITPTINIVGSISYFAS